MCRSSSWHKLSQEVAALCSALHSRTHLEPCLQQAVFRLALVGAALLQPPALGQLSSEELRQHCRCWGAALLPPLSLALRSGLGSEQGVAGLDAASQLASTLLQCSGGASGSTARPASLVGWDQLQEFTITYLLPSWNG